MTSEKKPNRPTLAITMIDVAWGDSILIESVDREGKLHLALIDSNDNGGRINPTYMFVKNHLERHWLEERRREPLFDFVMLSHAHSDHAQGLKSLIARYGTERFWYPKSNTTGRLSARFCDSRGRMIRSGTIRRSIRRSCFRTWAMRSYASFGHLAGTFIRMRI